MLVLTRHVGEYFNVYAMGELVAAVYVAAVQGRRRARIRIEYVDTGDTVITTLKTYEGHVNVINGGEPIAAVHLVEIRGRYKARIGIEADESVKIIRSEIDEGNQ